MYNTNLPTRAELPSTGQLLRSTAIAFITAIVLLFTAILPSEYAIDPTGIGSALGLTNMGEIKQQLAAEAELDAARDAIVVPAETLPEVAVPAPVEPQAAEGQMESVETLTEPVSKPEQIEWKDEVSLVLQPGEAAEIKIVMQAGAAADFEWVAAPGHLNSALHGDGAGGESITYRNGRAEEEHADTLIAAFAGSHGWFWRNRSDETVTMTLHLRGDYSEIKRVI